MGVQGRLSDINRSELTPSRLRIPSGCSLFEVRMGRTPVLAVGCSALRRPLCGGGELPLGGRPKRTEVAGEQFGLGGGVRAAGLEGRAPRQNQWQEHQPPPGAARKPGARGRGCSGLVRHGLGAVATPACSENALPGGSTRQGPSRKQHGAPKIETQGEFIKRNFARCGQSIGLSPASRPEGTKVRAVTAAQKR